MLSATRSHGESIMLRIGRVEIVRDAERVHMRTDASARRDAALMLALGLPIPHLDRVRADDQNLWSGR